VKSSCEYGNKISESVRSGKFSIYWRAECSRKTPP